MKHLIIYNTTEVLVCQPYLPGTGIAPGGDYEFLLTTLENAKPMLDAAGIDYMNFPVLVNL